jgi:molybdate transport system substrate-binding protein
MNWFWRAATAALALGLAQQAVAAEIKVLCIPAWKASFAVVLPQFERETGHKVTLHYAIYPQQKQQIESGEFDVAIFASPQIANLIKEGRLVSGSSVDIARSSIGVAVRAGAPKPDIATEEAFKKTLLAAKSITYTKQSQTGVYLKGALERIGVADAIKYKVILQPAGAMTTPAVARGEAELAIVLVSDILGTPGVDLVGPLPESLQHYVMQTAGLNAKAKEAAAGAAFIKFLASPAAGAVFRAKGLEPPPR